MLRFKIFISLKYCYYIAYIKVSNSENVDIETRRSWAVTINKFVTIIILYYKTGSSDFNFLGHIVDSVYIQKQPEKLVCITNFPVLKKAKDLHRFVGVYNKIGTIIIIRQ